MNCDQHVEDFETTEAQYSTIVYNNVFMLVSLMHHQGKDFHLYLVYISLQLHSDLLYALIWWLKRYSLLSLTLANFFFSPFLLAVWTACHALLFASKYLSLLSLAFIHNFLFSDIYLLTFSFHHQVCFFHMAFFVHPQVFSVAESNPCFNLDQILSTCSTEVSLISTVKVSQSLSWRSAGWSFHTHCFGTNVLHWSSFFTILGSQVHLKQLACGWQQI